MSASGSVDAGRKVVALTEPKPENNRFIGSTKLWGEYRRNNPCQAEDSEYTSPKVCEKLYDSVGVCEIASNLCINWVEWMGSPLKDLLRRH